MAKKDVELFFEKINKNETLKKELEKAEEGMINIKENELETFFNENLYPIVKKYGFDFSYADLHEYKHSLTPKNREELSDDELFNVAGGKRDHGMASCWHIGVGAKIGSDAICLIVGLGAGY